ncbi:MAG: hypothetical protein WC343_00330 [Bacilli bacterium]|jgi:hypothetical protein
MKKRIEFLSEIKRFLTMKIEDKSILARRKFGPVEFDPSKLDKSILCIKKYGQIDKKNH